MAVRTVERNEAEVVPEEIWHDTHSRNLQLSKNDKETVLSDISCDLRDLRMSSLGVAHGNDVEVLHKCNAQESFRERMNSKSERVFIQGSTKPMGCGTKIVVSETHPRNVPKVWR